MKFGVSQQLINTAFLWDVMFTTDGQSVLESGTPCQKIALFFILGRPLIREDGSVIFSTICQWSESQMTRNHTLLSLLGSLSIASYDSQGLQWKYSTLSDERTGL
jgi:hypothetical protein